MKKISSKGYVIQVINTLKKDEPMYVGNMSCGVDLVSIENAMIFSNKEDAIKARKHIYKLYPCKDFGYRYKLLWLWKDIYCEISTII